MPDKTDAPAGISKTQLDQLYKLLSTTVLSSSNMASTGASLTMFGGLPMQGEPWIIDLGALDHMMDCEKFFSPYVPSLGNHKVNIGDGSFTVIASVGTIELSPRIKLKGILHVRHLSCNLLSISKITKDLQCIVNFTPFLWSFRNGIRRRRLTVLESYPDYITLRMNQAWMDT